LRAKKWIDRSPFVGFKMSSNETHKTFLNEEELLLIAEQAITIKRLEKVRDIFFSVFFSVVTAEDGSQIQ
jgi:hypothetical protein